MHNNIRPINILIADDEKTVCDSIEENIKIQFLKYINVGHVNIKKAFTDHAYKHGCALVDEGFKPDICIFDLVFNGDTGEDLYNYIQTKFDTDNVYLCLYTGTEKTFDKRRKAEVLISSMQGKGIVISKPSIELVLQWFKNILKDEYNLEQIFVESDPFDLL